ncbi:MAG: hypothetical protein WCG45_01625 [bacterium]
MYENNLDFSKEIFYLDVTEKICILMKEKGISKKELSKKANLKKRKLVKFLSGNNDCVDFGKVIEMFFCMGCHLHLALKKKDA